jgi:hypothetical protein
MRVLIVIWLVASSACQIKKLSKREFLDKMEDGLPAAFCKPDQFFRQCADIDERGCIDLARSSLRGCFAQLTATMPDVIETPEDAKRVGRQIGECAGEAFDRAIEARGKRLHTGNCDNPQAWVK